MLGISAVTVGNGTPIIIVLLFPLLFLAGMTSLDTIESIMMLGAYGWAFVKPIRKLYYNFNIILVSVLIALVVGTIEALSITAQELNLSGSFWGWGSGQDFETLGFILLVSL